MRISTLLFLSFLPFLLKAQDCLGKRYQERIFSSVQVFQEVVYSQDAPSLLGSSFGAETTFDQDLVMDIYMPPPTDTVRNRPVVILAHGGGFVNIFFMGGTTLVGTKDNEDVQALADTLAHWGFVAASIQYRTGFDPANGSSVKRAVWRGSQDISAGIRFFRKNAQWFGIDPHKVFVGGSSAGAFACLHAAFVEESERIPESYEQNLFTDDLGSLHSRPVVELTGFNPFMGSNVAAQDVDSIPLAVASYWGAIADLDMLSGNNQAPVIFFHGDQDAIVDVDCARPFSSILLTAPVVCGSRPMDSVLTALNVPHQTQIEAGEGHEYWGVNNGDWGSNGPNSFWLPMIEQTAAFFYAQMRPAAPQIQGPVAAAPQQAVTYSVTQPQVGEHYCWSVQNGQIINQNANGSQVEIEFDAGHSSAQISLTAEDEAQLISLPRQKGINLQTSLANLSTAQSFYRVYPQPARQHLQIEGPAQEEQQLELYDALGRLLRQAQFMGQTQYFVGDLPAGQYYLRLKGAKSEAHFPIQLMD
ncbi:carboxylesterase family protein [Saprospira sp. CCB-QB6]|uniref:T9SS type A sorting domain-containing protein n=1 Tax=Saprospira sp. CCB-QB6 TaxID=3023936 RepID=UPI00234BFA28|nr:T9SS type A sorting domain-containing protein [Saprospira sp. CCB-QB6]WCL81905.1 carboxylesterase family protein [Saprospira sp. CCB-QB6]